MHHRAVLPMTGSTSGAPAPPAAAAAAAAGQGAGAAPGTQPLTEEECCSRSTLGRRKGAGARCVAAAPQGAVAHHEARRAKVNPHGFVHATGNRRRGLSWCASATRAGNWLAPGWACRGSRRLPVWPAVRGAWRFLPRSTNPHAHRTHASPAHGRRESGRDCGRATSATSAAEHLSSSSAPLHPLARESRALVLAKS
jgi:hypothetical protein